jgi:hypothetical protein
VDLLSARNVSCARLIFRLTPSTLC